MRNDLDMEKKSQLLIKEYLNLRKKIKKKLNRKKWNKNLKISKFIFEWPKMAQNSTENVTKSSADKRDKN